MKSFIACFLGLGVVLAHGPGFANPQRNLPIAFLGFDALHVANNGDTLAAEGFTGTRVFRIRADGTTTVVATGLQGPIDIAEDDEGALYVTNFLNATVSKIAPDGTVELFAQVLPFPAGIIRAPDGHFYVSHYGATDPDDRLRHRRHGAQDRSGGQRINARDRWLPGRPGRHHHGRRRGYLRWQLP